mgnify:CR=1 FL=1
MTSAEFGSIASALADRGLKVAVDAPFGVLTTYGVGGTAAVLVEVTTAAEATAVGETMASWTGVPVLVFGNGSNTLVSDDGFDGVAVRTRPGTSVEDMAVVVRNGTVTVPGWMPLPVLARRSVAAGACGLEWAVGVPGSVGGAVKMNAGGHGSDIAATLLDVVASDLNTGSIETIPVDELGLRFRGSDLGDDRIVISARFGLRPGDVAACEAEIAEIVRWRREHQPGGQNAGSVFVNPIPGELAAGQVIDELGLRGLRIGSAYVSEKHANFIQADPDGRAADVKAVIDAVRERVRRERGIELRSEIRLVGFREGST